MLFTLNDGKILIELARTSIDTFFSGKTILVPEADKFKDKHGIFVTLNLHGELRGCIGFPYAVYPLRRAVIEAARSAAFKDPRFSPVTLKEFRDITVEISVLTEPKRLEVESPEEYLNLIEIGRHGLIIKNAFNSGLLLPQVFTENESTPKEALDMTCQKAGLYEKAWEEEDTEVYIFEAQIFSETNPGGEVVEKSK
jgi:uncharacterized protein (TIGR00296 family)